MRPPGSPLADHWALQPMRKEGQLMPERIQLSRRKGWRKPEGVITVSRGTDWGNPFRVGEYIDVPIQGVDPIEIDRALAVALFRRYVEDRGWQDQIRRELAGKNLACWCPLDQPCHADVLLEIANGPADGPR